jgi:hypothetical protein
MRNNEDWESKLDPDELVDKKVEGKTIKTVLLKGLQRLADKAGLTKSRSEFFNFLDHKTQETVIQCVYITEFSDGTTWTGAGDCSSKNTNAPYSNYPTSVAESRAEARCLRKALGIRILSSEEIDVSGTGDVSPSTKVDSSVVAAIEQLCLNKGMKPVDLLNSIIKDKKRANSIFELKQLTVEEGQKAMEHLNSIKDKRKTKK